MYLIDLYPIFVVGKAAPKQLIIRIPLLGNILIYGGVSFTCNNVHLPLIFIYILLNHTLKISPGSQQTVKSSSINYKTFFKMFKRLL